MAVSPVLVIGGTRATGLLVVRALQQRDVRTRVLARRPLVAVKRLGAGVEIVRGDITKAETLPAAVHGAAHIVFTAGVRSGRPAREAIVRATEYEGVVNTLTAARTQGFSVRFVYMTAFGANRRSWSAWAPNARKGNTLLWRARAEDAIRASGFEYTIVRAAVLLNRARNRHSIRLSQENAPLFFGDCIARADVADAIVEANAHPAAARATIEIRWDRRGTREAWRTMFSKLQPDTL